MWEQANRSPGSRRRRRLRRSRGGKEEGGGRGDKGGIGERHCRRVYRRKKGIYRKQVSHEKRFSLLSDLRKFLLMLYVIYSRNIFYFPA